MDESFPTRRRDLLSMRTFSYRSMAKFLLTISLVLLFCYHPSAFMVDEQPTAQVSSTDHSDIISLEVGSSIKEEIYRFIQRFYTGLTDEQEIALAKLIYDESQRYDCDPKLVLALIMVESSFYVKATSPKGARGLMQLRPYVAKALAQEVGIKWNEAVIYDPEVNVKLGLYYLSQLIVRFKNLKVAITAYNFGPTYTRERMSKGKPLPVRYANKVLKNYQKLSHENHTGGAKSL